jgi:hypothetical protein
MFQLFTIEEICGEPMCLSGVSLQYITNMAELICFMGAARIEYCVEDQSHTFSLVNCFHCSLVVEQI